MQGKHVVQIGGVVGFGIEFQGQFFSEFKQAGIIGNQYRYGTVLGNDGLVVFNKVDGLVEFLKFVFKEHRVPIFL